MEKPKYYNQTQNKASQKYHKEHMKRIPLSVQITEYETIKAAAQAAGEPVNTYIKNAIRARMDTKK